MDIFLNPYYMQIASFILINIILGISIYLTLATGQLSLGNAGFMSIGAYASAMITVKLGLPIPVGILVGSLAAALSGILVGIPTLRLQGVYLAIATLGFGEVIRVWFNNLQITNGATGIPGIPHMGRIIAKQLREIGITYEMFGVRNNQFVALILFLLLFVIVILLVWFFVRQNRSRIGRAFMAIKADEKAAEAMGINTTYFKILAFAQGALVAGFAGALYAHTTTFIIPGDFSYRRAVEILIFAVFGGSEVIWGPVFGATFLTLMPEVLREVAEYRYMVYGVILVLLMAFRPQGLMDVYFLKWMQNKFKRKRIGASTPSTGKDLSKGGEQ